ncbi:MAG TPA: hypothetical protein VNU01_03230, partial [Egibacteraceae bacterium]|nr:hypothetical protein [Egibacteraceae bacterium]
LPVGAAVLGGAVVVTALAGVRGAVAVAAGVVVAVAIGVWARRRDDRWTTELADAGALVVETIALLATVAVR